MDLDTHLAALAARADGRQPGRLANFKRWRPADFAAHGGSKNADLMGYAAAGDYGWVADLARHQVESAGLWMDECVAFDFYFDGPFVAYAVALRMAIDAGDHGAAAWIRRPMRAMLHLHALAAVPVSQLRGWQMIGVGNAPGRITWSSARRHRGVTTPVVGDRFHPERAVGGNSMGMWLSWATAWPGRDRRPLRLGSRVRPYELCQEPDVLANLACVSRYTADVDPRTFGLQPGDPDLMRRAIQGDREAASRCAHVVVDECPPGHRYDFLRLRTDRGGEAYSLSGIAQGNKPHAVASDFDNETATLRLLLPSEGVKTGANVGLWVRVGDEVVEAGAANRSGRPSRVSMPRLGGRVLYGFRFRERRVIPWHDGGAVAADTPPPPAPGKPAPVDPPPRLESDGWVVITTDGTRLTLEPAVTPRQPLRVRSKDRGGPLWLTLAQPVSQKPFAYAIHAATGERLVVEDLPSGVTRHLLEVSPAENPSRSISIVVESQGETSDLLFIREHR